MKNKVKVAKKNNWFGEGNKKCELIIGSNVVSFVDFYKSLGYDKAPNDDIEAYALEDKWNAYVDQIEMIEQNISENYEEMCCKKCGSTDLAEKCTVWFNLNMDGTREEYYDDEHEFYWCCECKEPCETEMVKKCSECDELEADCDCLKKK